MYRLAYIVCLGLAAVGFRQAKAAIKVKEEIHECVYDTQNDNPFDQDSIYSIVYNSSSEERCAWRCNKKEDKCQSANFIQSAEVCILYKDHPADRWLDDSVIFLYNIECDDLSNCNYDEKNQYFEDFGEDSYLWSYDGITSADECAHECDLDEECETASFFPMDDFCSFYNATPAKLELDNTNHTAVLLYDIHCEQCTYKTLKDNPFNESAIFRQRENVRSELGCALFCKKKEENCLSANYIETAQYCILYNEYPTSAWQHDYVFFLYNIDCDDLASCDFDEKNQYYQDLEQNHYLSSQANVENADECAHGCATEAGCVSASYYPMWKWCDFYDDTVHAAAEHTATLIYDIHCGGESASTGSGYESAPTAGYESWSTGHQSWSTAA